MASLLKLKDSDDNVLVDLMLTWGVVDKSWKYDYSNEGIDMSMELFHPGPREDFYEDLNDLQVALRLTDEYNDDSTEYLRLVLEMKADEETGSKDSFIVTYHLIPTFMDAVMESMFIESGYALYQLTLTITPLETPTDVTISYDGIDAHGGYISVPNTVSSAPLDSRIRRMDIVPVDWSGHNQTWVGIQECDESTTTFNPLSQHTHYSWKASDVTLVSDSKGYGGQCLESNFTQGETLDTAIYYLMEDWGGGIALADWPDYRGKFRVLARMRLTNTTTAVGVRLRARMGYSSDIFAEYPKVYMHGSDKWNVFELGEITLFPERLNSDIVANYDARQYRLDFQIERFEGSGNWRFDSWVLMPSNHMLYVGDNYGGYGGFRVYDNGDGTLTVVADDGATPPVIYSFPTATPVNWSFPRQGGVIVFAWARVGAYATTYDHEIAAINDFDVDLWIRHRWLDFRS